MISDLQKQKKGPRPFSKVLLSGWSAQLILLLSAIAKVSSNPWYLLTRPSVIVNICIVSALKFSALIRAWTNTVFPDSKKLIGSSARFVKVKGSFEKLSSIATLGPINVPEWGKLPGCFSSKSSVWSFYQPYKSPLKKHSYTLIIKSMLLIFLLKPRDFLSHYGWIHSWHLIYEKFSY